MRAAGDDRADIACTDQAQRLAGNFDAHEIVFRPFARLRTAVGGGDLAGKRHNHGNRVFGRRDRIAERGVHHHHALAAGIRDIDIIDANASATDDLEIGRGIKNFGRHLGRGTDGEAIVFADAGFEFFRRFARDDIDVAAALFENLGGVRVHLVADEDFGFAHDGIFLSFPRRFAGSIIRGWRRPNAQAASRISRS